MKLSTAAVVVVVAVVAFVANTAVVDASPVTDASAATEDIIDGFDCYVDCWNKYLGQYRELQRCYEENHCGLRPGSSTA